MKKYIIATTGFIATTLTAAGLWIFTLKDLLEIMPLALVAGIFAAGTAGIIYEKKEGEYVDKKHVIHFVKLLKLDGADQATCAARLAGFFQGAAAVRPTETLTLTEISEILNTLSDTGTKKKPQRHSW